MPTDPMTPRDALNEVALITVRPNSQRLDRKYKEVITPEGDAQLDMVFKRVTASGMLTYVVHPQGEVGPWCDNRGISHIDCGPDDRDVVRQLLFAAEQALADRIFLVTGDCSFIDPSIINEAADVYANYKDMPTVLEYGPAVRGLPVRVASYDTLVQIDKALSDHRKHGLTYGLYQTYVQQVLHERVDPVKLGPNLFWPAVGFPQINMSLDTPEDLAFIREIYSRVDRFATWEEALRCAYAIKTLPSIRPTSLPR